jgi:hypothetical protein
MLLEGKQPLPIPLTLLQLNSLLLLSIYGLNIRTRDLKNLNISPHSLQLNLEVLSFANINHNTTHHPLLIDCSTDIQPASAMLQHALQPLRLCRPIVRSTPHMATHSPATHVLAEEQQRPPRGLLDDPIRSRHQRADDIDALGDIRHADVFALADEDVEPDGHGQSVREGVELLSALFTGGADGVPDVPFVEADFSLWRVSWGDSGYAF